jgi:hypothetical protein
MSNLRAPSEPGRGLVLFPEITLPREGLHCLTLGFGTSRFARRAGSPEEKIVEEKQGPESCAKAHVSDWNRWRA